MPPAPGNEALQQPGQLGYIRDVWNNFRNPLSSELKGYVRRRVAASGIDDS